MPSEKCQSPVRKVARYISTYSVAHTHALGIKKNLAQVLFLRREPGLNLFYLIIICT